MVAWQRVSEEIYRERTDIMKLESESSKDVGFRPGGWVGVGAG